jgi:hypothetical protein
MCDKYLKIECYFGESGASMNGSNANCMNLLTHIYITYAVHTCMTFTKTTFNPYNCRIKTNYISISYSL